MPINQRLLKECKERQDYREFNGDHKGLYPAEQAIFDGLPSNSVDADIKATEEVLKKVIKVVWKDEPEEEECKELLEVANEPSEHIVRAVAVIDELDDYF